MLLRKQEPSAIKQDVLRLGPCLCRGTQVLGPEINILHCSNIVMGKKRGRRLGRPFEGGLGESASKGTL